MSTDNELNVIIAGTAGTGKSTLLALIYKLLLDNGFENVTIDDNPGDFYNVVQNMDSRVDVLKTRKINLITKQANRGV